MRVLPGTGEKLLQPCVLVESVFFHAWYPGLYLYFVQSGYERTVAINIKVSGERLTHKAQCNSRCRASYSRAQGPQTAQGQLHPALLWESW